MAKKPSLDHAYESAALARDPAALQEAMNSGADPALVDGNKRNALMLCAFAAFPEGVRMLVAQNRCKPGAKDRMLRTAFGNAVISAKFGTPSTPDAIECVRELASPKVIDAGGDLDRSALHDASHDCDAPMVAALLGLGADPKRADSAGWTPLMFAATAIGSPRAKECFDMLAPLSDVAAVNGRGETALHWLSTLLRSPEGRDAAATIIDIAACSGKAESLEAVDADGRTPAQRAGLVGKEDSQWMSERILAAKEGRLAAKMSERHAGADPEGGSPKAPKA